jgi:AraC-like DNA-binding protein
MSIIETRSALYPEIKKGFRRASQARASRSLLLDETFQHACALIDQKYYDCQLNAQGLARQLRCSRSTLYRAFQVNGVTVADYIQRVRFHHVQARFALSPPRIPISSIAMDCGFECLRHFNRRFKQLFGHTPGVCRNALRRTSTRERNRDGHAFVPLRIDVSGTTLSSLATTSEKR